MKSLTTLFALLILSFNVFAEEGAIVSATRPVDVDATFEEEYFQTKPWINEFQYVVVVNKADEGREAQSIKVYEKGALIANEKVSTGRDEFERKGEHHSKSDSWSVTPTGYYTPSYLDKDHRSSAYGGKWSWLVGGTKMPYAIFFNDGIALHQAPKGTEDMLGSKASGGCVRLPGDLAKELFGRISKTEGFHHPLFTVEGEAKLDSAGNIRYSSEEHFSALIIVVKKVVE